MTAARAGRLLLALAAGTSVLIGLWAAVAPRSFYDEFPGGGRSWVSADGPFNEHLVRDFGGLNLALAVFLGAAAWTLVPVVVRAAAAGYAVYGLPHLVYHLRHLDRYDVGDQIASITSLVLALVLTVVGAVLLEPRWRDR